MDPYQKDPGFGRFAFTVITIALVIITLGLAGIYYYFQYGGAGTGTTLINSLVKRGQALPPGQAMLYYTKDGRQLVSTPAELGDSNLNHSEKAKRIMDLLVAGTGSGGMRSALPEGTKLINVFINKDLVIVNLSREMMSNLVGGPDAELLAVYAVVNSLQTNLEGIDGVQILIEGDTMPTLRGHVDISSPLIVNAAIMRTN